MSGCHLAFKATNEKDVGYGVYDLGFQGESHQKGLSAPSMGLKKTIFKPQALKAQGIQPMADFNHKAAADHMEAFQVS